MPETLRSELPDPTHYQKMVNRPMPLSPDMAKIANRVFDREIQENSGINVVTRSNPDAAYEVAHAIKPEIEAATALQNRLDNPMATGAYVYRDGKNLGLTGVEATDSTKLKLKAAEADLERNANAATMAYVAKRVGRLIVSSEVA